MPWYEAVSPTGVPGLQWEGPGGVVRTMTWYKEELPLGITCWRWSGPGSPPAGDLGPPEDGPVPAGDLGPLKDGPVPGPPNDDPEPGDLGPLKDGPVPAGDLNDSSELPAAALSQYLDVLGRSTCRLAVLVPPPPICEPIPNESISSLVQRLEASDTPIGTGMRRMRRLEAANIPAGEWMQALKRSKSNPR